MNFYLYDRTYITPQQLIDTLRACESRWPGAHLHKNENTRNLTVKVDDVSVGMVDLLDATLVDFTDDDDSTAFIAGAAEGIE